MGQPCPRRAPSAPTRPFRPPPAGSAAQGFPRSHGPATSMVNDSLVKAWSTGASGQQPGGRIRAKMVKEPHLPAPCRDRSWRSSSPHLGALHASGGCSTPIARHAACKPGDARKIASRPATRVDRGTPSEPASQVSGRGRQPSEPERRSAKRQKSVWFEPPAIPARTVLSRCRQAAADAGVVLLRHHVLDRADDHGQDRATDAAADQLG